MSDEAKNADEKDQAVDSNESSTLETMEAKMAVLRGEVEDDDSSVVNDETNLEDDDSTDDSDKKDDDSTDDSDKKDDDSPILPSGHRQAALKRGWTNEEIDHYLETKPNDAVVEFKEIFGTWQKENSLWSERGRQLIAAGKTSEEDGEKSKADETSEALAHYDLDALIETHGNEDLLKAIIGPINAVIDRVNDAAKKVSNSENFLRNTEQEALVTVAQNFFKSPEIKPFNETYGIEAQNLTDKQLENRMKLFEQADIMVAGARDHGVDISVQDALERAHILLSQGTRDEALRQSIRDDIKKRTKTLKGSHQQTSSSDTDRPISDEEMVTRTEARMAAIRNK